MLDTRPRLQDFVYYMQANAGVSKAEIPDDGGGLGIGPFAWVLLVRNKIKKPFSQAEGQREATLSFFLLFFGLRGFRIAAVSGHRSFAVVVGQVARQENHPPGCDGVAICSIWKRGRNIQQK
jgi:hypothetical protein